MENLSTIFVDKSVLCQVNIASYIAAYGNVDNVENLSTIFVDKSVLHQTNIASYIASYRECGQCGKLIHNFCG